MPEFGSAAKALSHAPEIVIFTGAGISAESGIPTYNDPLTGIWAPYDPRTMETAKAFREILRWYGDGTCGRANRSLKQLPMMHISR
ncbi:Silent information regulator protein Sir2 [Pseudomonas syringae pv. aptata]|uniref:Silent information regulator protein Sir2 n=2 Tax=Pseudomonas syringae group TaxID=136849 RepID=A0A3M4YAP7_9PSED|nr:Silent information regulator protein Sir2 [Pseudomonas syringae pv. aptata]RMO65272.1 Silent information regulator protein Sir2 [Pseudomonas syringae pv. aptata]RMR85133.1 Silent information regulator protein Sir2 [Pseudomonas coronafaciens pv. striafaciens]